MEVLVSSTSRAASAGYPTAPANGALAVLLLAISAFVIVTTEFIIVGLLPSMARDLGMSIASAGRLVTLFAFTVMLFGPLLTGLVSHFDRKKLFVALLFLFAFSNALVAIASNVWIVAIGRVLPALALPVFWGTSSETAAQLAGPERSGRAVSNVYMGIAAAMVFGIPVGTLVGNAVGWRGTFWILAALSLAMALLLLLVMPVLQKPARLELGHQMRILRNPMFLGNLVLSVVVFTAMFTSYTYLADLLERLAHIPTEAVGWWLMGFGVVGLAGNWLGGHLVGTHPLRATLIAAVVLAVGMAATTLAVGNAFELAIALGVWGLANTALYPICQVRVMRAAAHSQALAGTLNVSMANAGIGLGAIIGGMTIEKLGIGQIGYVAAAMAIVAVLLGPLIARLSNDQSD